VHNVAQVKYSRSDRRVNVLTGCHICWLVNVDRSFNLPDAVLCMVTTGLCTMRREVGVRLWWMAIWCVRSTRECVTTDVSQFLICPCTFLRFQGLYDTVSSGKHGRRPHSMRRVYKNLCPATISVSIMAANMWKNSLMNVESDNNKILHETLLDFLQRNGTYCLNKPRSISLHVLDSTNIMVHKDDTDTIQLWYCITHRVSHSLPNPVFL